MIRGSLKCITLSRVESPIAIIYSVLLAIVPNSYFSILCLAQTTLFFLVIPIGFSAFLFLGSRIFALLFHETPSANTALLRIPRLCRA